MVRCVHASVQLIGKATGCTRRGSDGSGPAARGCPACPGACRRQGARQAQDSPQGLSCVRARCVGPRSRRKTHSAACGRCVQTCCGESEVEARCARRPRPCASRRRRFAPAGTARRLASAAGGLRCAGHRRCPRGRRHPAGAICGAPRSAAQRGESGAQRRTGEEDLCGGAAAPSRSHRSRPAERASQGSPAQRDRPSVSPWRVPPAATRWR